MGVCPSLSIAICLLQHGQWYLEVNRLNNEDCSGKSTEVPVWRKLVVDGFEVIIGQKIFWQNFRRFGPFPVGVMQRSSGGQNFKMLQMTFHVYQISRDVRRITKIYILLCAGCMVREILTLSCLPIYPVSSLTVFYHKMGYHNDLHISLEVLKELQPNFTEMWLRHQAFIKR